MDDFYLNMLIGEFERDGHIGISSPAFVREFIDALEERGMACVVINGFNSGSFGAIKTIIAKPQFTQRFKNILSMEISEARRKIALKKNSLLEENIIRINC